MNTSALTHQQIFRPGSESNGCTVAERYSVDFLIDGESLLSILVKVDGGHADFMGCFVKGFAEPAAKAAAMLLLQAAPDSASGRVLLYVCPECGEIGCGAYAVRIEKTDIGYSWGDFAYENGYEEPHVIEGVGRFFFDRDAYESAIGRAAAL
jgi:hypothetical protein